MRKLYMVTPDGATPYHKRKGRKEHKCGVCENLIKKGEEYYALEVSPILFRMAMNGSDPNDVIVVKSCVECYFKGVSAAQFTKARI